MTDGRFSGGTRGLCFGHVQDEAYNGGLIAFVKDGDKIQIDIINIQSLHTFIESVFGCFIPMITIPKLGGDE